VITQTSVAERLPYDDTVVVDFNEDERDPAWCAFCNSGYWHGTWFHADEFGEPDDQAARDAAEQAAKEEGEQHRADVHHD
jgi:hypothetical protein